MNDSLTLTIPRGEYVRRKEDVDALKLYDSFIHIVCVMENIYLPSAERSLLSYYAVDGSVNPETEKKFMNDTNRNKQSVSNLKYMLTKHGFLTKKEDSNSHELPNFLKQRRDALTIIIELNARTSNTSESSK